MLTQENQNDQDNQGPKNIRLVKTPERRLTLGKGVEFDPRKKMMSMDKRAQPKISDIFMKYEINLKISDSRPTAQNISSPRKHE